LSGVALIPPLAHRRLAFAVDARSTLEAAPLVSQLAPHIGVLKVGLELFLREGPPTVGWARSYGVEVFLDLKLHDIPETVERAVTSVASLGARYLTVHATGGATMLERSVKAAEGSGLSIVAVTVLTSLDEADLRAINVGAAPAAQALTLARLAWSAGVRAFVCSPAEVALLRGELGLEALLITPGIRPQATSGDDQKRVATARDAAAAGADLLVVGRPLRDAADPIAAAKALAAQVDEGTRSRA
jgi:orotidine-5'-phosphate decarboxylase